MIFCTLIFFLVVTTVTTDAAITHTDILNIQRISVVGSDPTALPSIQSIHTTPSLFQVKFIVGDTEAQTNQYVLTLQAGEETPILTINSDTLKSAEVSRTDDDQFSLKFKNQDILRFTPSKEAHYS